MTRVATVRSKLLAPGDEKGAIRFFQSAYKRSRMVGFAQQEQPSAGEIEEGMPDEFRYQEHETKFAGVTLMRTLRVSPLNPEDFNYGLWQSKLNDATDTLMHGSVSHCMNVLLSYAETRNASKTRSDHNISYGRNRVIIWLCHELLQISKMRPNEDLIRRLDQLLHFLGELVDRGNVDVYYPDSKKEGGSNGFPTQLNNVLVYVNKMRRVTESTIQMRSLGEMFFSVGTSLRTSVKNLGLSALYFAADRTICPNKDGKAGTTFNYNTFYAHNREGHPGEYEPWLLDTSIGHLFCYFNDLVTGRAGESAINKPGFVNPFLAIRKEDHDHSFTAMARAILPEEFSGFRPGVWSGFGSKDFFPAVQDGQVVAQGPELPAEIIEYLGYALEVARIANQFVASKTTANFVGDYNWVYNAHLRWGLQALLVQWGAISDRVEAQLQKMQAVHKSVFVKAPKVKSPFHSNASVLARELDSAACALRAAAGERKKIEARLRELHNPRYLKQKCEEAELFVSGASRSAANLYNAGVLTEEQYDSIKLFEPRSKGLGSLSVFESGGAEKSSEAGKEKSPPHTPRSILVAGDNASRAIKRHIKDLQTDQALWNAQFVDKSTPAEYKQDLELYKKMEAGSDWEPIKALVVSSVDDHTFQPCLHDSSEEVGRDASGNFIVHGRTFESHKLFEQFANKQEKRWELNRRSPGVNYMLGRYAKHLGRENRLAKSEEAFKYVTNADVLVEKSDREAYVSAARSEYMHNLFAVESGLARLDTLFEAIRAVEPTYQVGSGRCQFDWQQVDRRCEAVPGDALFHSGVNNLIAHFNKINDLLASAQRIRLQLEEANNTWGVRAVSKSSFLTVFRELNDKKIDLRKMIIERYGVDVDNKTSVASVASIKKSIEQQYRPAEVKSVEQLDEQIGNTEAFGKTYHVAKLDRHGECHRGIRFDLPRSRHNQQGFDRDQQRVIGSLITDKTYLSLRRRIQQNQSYYDKNINRYRQASVRGSRQSSKMNYAIMGAGKAAVMQSYCNELLLRIESAMKDEARWESVHHFLGGRDLLLDTPEQCRAFLRRESLTFSVRLCDQQGQFDDEDTVVNCASHRHGEHSGVSAENFWGRRGRSDLPATSQKLIDFIKVARLKVEQHLQMRADRQAVI